MCKPSRQKPPRAAGLIRPLKKVKGRKRRENLHRGRTAARVSALQWPVAEAVGEERESPSAGIENREVILHADWNPKSWNYRKVENKWAPDRGIGTTMYGKDFVISGTPLHV